MGGAEIIGTHKAFAACGWGPDAARREPVGRARADSSRDRKAYIHIYGEIGTDGTRESRCGPYMDPLTYLVTLSVLEFRQGIGPSQTFLHGSQLSHILEPPIFTYHLTKLLKTEGMLEGISFHLTLSGPFQVRFCYRFRTWYMSNGS